MGRLPLRQFLAWSACRRGGSGRLEQAIGWAICEGPAIAPAQPSHQAPPRAGPGCSRHVTKRHRLRQEGSREGQSVETAEYTAVDTKVGFPAVDMPWDWCDSRQLSGAGVDIELGKPHVGHLWLPKFYVHIPHQMSTRCPYGHEGGIYVRSWARRPSHRLLGPWIYRVGASPEHPLPAFGGAWPSSTRITDVVMQEFVAPRR